MGKKKERRAALAALEEARTEHARLLAQVEKAQAKAERRAAKLRALEARLFELQQQTHDPAAGRLGQAPAGDEALRDARLIVNPTAGGVDGDAEKVTEIVACLRAHGIRADLGLKTSGKAARELAQEAVDQEQELVIVAAGDGTLEEVALTLLHSKTALGILPVGTSNNLARSLGIPLALDDAYALLGMGATRLIDVARVRVEGGDGASACFVETGGVGLTAIMIPAGQALRKQRWTDVSRFFRKVLDVHPDPLALELASGEIVPVQSQVVTVSNAPLGAVNILLAPEAKMDDGLLDVTVYEDMSRTDLLAYFLAASRGEPARHPSVRTYRVERVTIRSPHPISAHADKEELPEALAFTFEAVPKALRVVAGQGVALTLPVEAVPSVPPLAGPQTDEHRKANGRRAQPAAESA